MRWWCVQKTAFFYHLIVKEKFSNSHHCLDLRTGKMSKDILLNKLGFLNWLLGPQTLYSIIWGRLLLPTHQNFVQDFIYIFDAIVHFIIISEFLKFIVLLFYLFCSVGDPFKDTAGPSLHVLIKMLATITLVMAPIFL